MILTGCVHIHSKGIVHRDFKFENVLVDKSTGKLKIIDFGMSKNENEE
jgi:serine/threonine protein kinase